MSKTIKYCLSTDRARPAEYVYVGCGKSSHRLLRMGKFARDSLMPPDAMSAPESLPLDWVVDQMTTWLEQTRDESKHDQAH